MRHIADRVPEPQTSPAGHAWTRADGGEGVAVIGHLDPAVAAALAGELERRGYRAIAVPDPGEALVAAARGHAVAAVLYRGFVEAAAPELLGRLRAAMPLSPLIIAGPEGTTPVAPEHNAICSEDDAPAHLADLVDCGVAVARSLGRSRAEHEVRSLILAKLCHDLRSPLHVIQGYTEVLRGDPAAAPFENILERLAGATDTAIGLIGDYLDLARLNAPGMAIRRERVDLEELVQDLRAAAELRIGKRPLAFEVSSAAARSYLYADGDILRAVLGQLLANAVKFTPSGAIRLSICGGHGETRFEVADQGPGISDAELPGLFTPFRQGAPGALSSTPGEGVGLAMASRLTALLGGSLAAARRRDGGALFTLRLPEGLHAYPQQARERVLH